MEIYGWDAFLTEAREGHYLQPPQYMYTFVVHATSPGPCLHGCGLSKVANARVDVID